MNSVSALQLLCAIDQTIADIDSVSGRGNLEDSYFAKFLVVYISGVYEEVIENIVVDFVGRSTARGEIVSYIETNLARFFQNPSPEKIVELVKKFNPNWVPALQSMDTEKRALTSIVNNKNALAHGQPLTITLSEIKNYYALSRIFIEKVDSIFN